MTITRITAAAVYRYDDSGQIMARVDWRDKRGRHGTTAGKPDNEHMAALLARAAREGVEIFPDRRSDADAPR